LLSRLWDTFLVLFGVATLVFLFIHLIPGDPVDVMLGESATVADRAELVSQLGLDKPISTQLFEYYQQLFQFNLGESLHQKRPVMSLLAERIPATLLLTLSSFIIAVLVSFVLGVWAAMHKDAWQDKTASGLALAGLSIPNFWLGPLLILLFSVGLGWTPVSGMDDISSLILPALTLGTSLAAISMRMVRSSLLENSNMDYVRTARAKGLSQIKAMWVHVLPNALLPVVTLLGLQLGALLAGSVITEMVFSWPGIGSLIVESIQKRDYPVLQGCILFISMSYVLVNFLTDLLYRWIDPRLRYEV